MREFEEPSTSEKAIETHFTYFIGVVVTARHEISTKGQNDAHDITAAVAAAVSTSGIRAGVATVFVVGSTAGVTTIEFEPGAIADLNQVFEELAPRRGEYRHHLRWGDDNGSSHVRAAMLGPSMAVPFVAGALTLGTWQQIMLLEFDTRPRRREIVIQIIGESGSRESGVGSQEREPRGGSRGSGIEIQAGHVEAAPAFAPNERRRGKPGTWHVAPGTRKERRTPNVRTTNEIERTDVAQQVKHFGTSGEISKVIEAVNAWLKAGEGKIEIVAISESQGGQIGSEADPFYFSMNVVYETEG